MAKKQKKQRPELPASIMDRVRSIDSVLTQGGPTDLFKSDPAKNGQARAMYMKLIDKNNRKPTPEELRRMREMMSRTGRGPNPLGGGSLDLSVIK